MNTLSPWQHAIAQHYGGGDYAYVTSLDECRDVGDTLFTFLMIETDRAEDCDGWQEALPALKGLYASEEECAAALGVTGRPDNRVHRMSPGTERSKERSRFSQAWHAPWRNNGVASLSKWKG
jgi:hypothetical protein